MRRSLLPFAIAVALVEATGAIWIVWTSDHEPHKYATTALAVTAGLSFVASGLIALARRPENRTGLYLAAVGYLWFFGALSDANSRVAWTVGVFLTNLAFVPFAALVLAFPTGRLARRPDRLLVRATAGFVLVGPPLLLLFAKQPPSCGKNCGESAIVLYRSPAIERVVDVAGSAFVVVLTAAVVVVLARRWRKAGRALRRLLLPVYVAGGSALVVLLLSNLFSTFSTTAADTVGPAFLVFFATVVLVQAAPRVVFLPVLAAASRAARSRAWSSRSAAGRRSARRSPRHSAIPRWRSATASTRGSGSSTATAVRSSCRPRARGAPSPWSSTTVAVWARSCTTRP